METQQVATSGKNRCMSGWKPSLVLTVLLMLNAAGGAGSRRTLAEELSAITDLSLQRTAASLEKFVDKLPTMPVLKAYDKSSDGTYVPVNLTIGMYVRKWKFHRDLPSATVYAYGTSKHSASVPGPTIWAVAGVPAYILWENWLPNKHMFTIDHTIDAVKLPSEGGIPTVVHLHGTAADPASDGFSTAWFTAGFARKGPSWQTAVYTYPNVKGHAVNMWYHDHAMGYTRLNLLAGLVGAYSVREPDRDVRLRRLPSKKFDRHLVVFDKSFTRDGQIYINSTGDNPTIHPEWQPEYFGDVVIVNGKAWPHLKVQRRKYRFRIINASNARFYKFALTNGLTFTQIGADSFYLEKPVVMSTILVAPSEIVDVVVDFSHCMANETILTNSAAYPFPDGDPPNELNGKVMKFIIKAAHVKEKSVVPTGLLPVERLADPVATRTIVLIEMESAVGEPVELLINFNKFSDPVTDTPKVGSVELWQIINLTEDNHPFHVHLAPFQVIGTQALLNFTELVDCVKSRRSLTACHFGEHINSTVVLPPANEAGWKTVFKMEPKHVTKFLIRFSLFKGAPFPFDATMEPGYVYHCHILDHEDNSMMRPFKLIH